MNLTGNPNLNTKAYWDRRYSSEVDEMWTIWTTHDLIEKVAAHIPHMARVLDVGCGAGIVPARMNKLRADIQWSACDFSEAAINYLRSFGLVKFQDLFVADIRNGLSCASGAYDAVLCTEVLEHLESPGDAIREFCRVANDRLIITVPNGSAIPSSEHVVEFNPDDLAGLLLPYGPTIIDTCRGGRNLIGVCLCR